MSLLSLGLRSEYKIIRRWYFPYLSLDLLVNYFDETKIKTDLESDTSELYHVPWWVSAQLYSKGTRFGAGAGLGYNFDISSKFVIDFHANYTIFNLLGKREKKNLLGENGKEENLDAINFSISILHKM
ncbi:hypothetical protein H8E88_16670 [candidate division KSB1 bacterium]|nr:hypothetical protein [candidate division KSB1 bacterium]MBL7093053.1 hypothetical protein [candidate division KSB1 bacterium]